MSAGASAPALRRWLLSLGIVLAAHALLVAALLGWPSRTPAPALAAPAQALMLELAPAPVAPPAAPTDLAPGPVQRERRDAAPAPAPLPVPVPHPAPTPPPSPIAAAPIQPQAPLAPTSTAQDATPADDAAQASAPPSIAAPPAERYAAPQSAAGAAPQARITWQAQVLGHLQRYKRYPRAAQRRRQEGIAQVGFAVDRSGHASDIQLVRSSGYEALDAEALATVRRADPLPALPAEVPGDPVQVMVPMDFFLR